MHPLAAVVAAALIFSARAANAGEGMPQLDFANPLTLAQVVWGGIIFFVLYLLLSRWALPQVAEVLETRAATIATDLDAARHAKDEADQAVAAQTEATRQANAAAQARIAEAVGQAKQQAEARSVELNARLDTQLAEAETRISAARSSAMAALRDVATDTATAVVTRLTGFAPDAGRVRDAVGAELEARGQA